MSKAKDLLPGIIGASTNKEAIEMLHEVLEALHLSSNYTDLIKIKDELQLKKDEYKLITLEYDSSDMKIEDMLNTRKNTAFLYRDVSDSFSYKVNFQKIFWEEKKSNVRAQSMKNLKNNPEAQEIFNAKSTSALRDIVGIDDSYQEYIVNASISYALYQELINFLNSIRQFIDYLASAIKNEQLIKQHDVK